MEKLPYEAPTKPYVWGTTYEVRDKFNGVIVRFELMKGDIHYRRNLEVVTKVLSALMNGESWVENNGSYKLQSFGNNVEETIVKSTPEKTEEEKAIDAKIAAINEDQEKDEGQSQGVQPAKAAFMNTESASRGMGGALMGGQRNKQIEDLIREKLKARK